MHRFLSISIKVIDTSWKKRLKPNTRFRLLSLVWFSRRSTLRDLPYEIKTSSPQHPAVRGAYPWSGSLHIAPIVPTVSPDATTTRKAAVQPDVEGLCNCTNKPTGESGFQMLTWHTRVALVVANESTKRESEQGKRDGCSCCDSTLTGTTGVQHGGPTGPCITVKRN